MAKRARDSFWDKVTQRLAGLRWQDIFVIEASGIRTVAAAVVPLICGQIAGDPATGLMIGVGGLQVAFADMPGATRAALLWAAVASVVVVSLGAAVSHAPVILAVALMFMIAFLMSMLSSFGSVAGNIGFVTTVTYAFAQNAPVSLQTGWKYVVGFGIGGIWAVSLTFLLWHLRERWEKGRVDAGDSSLGSDESPDSLDHELPWWEKLRADLNPRTEVFQHAVRTAIATAITAAICHVYHPPHGFWLILTVLVILKPDYAATWRRTVERVLGSIIGGLAAMLPVAFTHNVIVLDVLLVIMGIIAFSHLPRNYGLYVLFLTPFIVFFTTVAAPMDNQVALARIYETMIGGAVAFTIAFFLRAPRHWLPEPRQAP